jgi:hypothetical protein
MSKSAEFGKKTQGILGAKGGLRKGLKLGIPCSHEDEPKLVSVSGCMMCRKRGENYISHASMESSHKASHNNTSVAGFSP